MHPRRIDARPFLRGKTRTADVEPYFSLFPTSPPPFSQSPFLLRDKKLRRSRPRLSRNTIHGARGANISSFAYRARRGHLHSSVPVLFPYFRPAAFSPHRVRTRERPSTSYLIPFFHRFLLSLIFSLLLLFYFPS